MLSEVLCWVASAPHLLVARLRAISRAATIALSVRKKCAKVNKFLQILMGTEGA